MTITLRKAIAGLAAAGSLTLAGAEPALAAPVKPATAFQGFYDCTNLNGGTPSITGKYVVNVGNSSAQTTWNPGFVLTGLTGTAVFIQNAQTWTAPFVTPTVVKGSATPGPWECSLWSATEPTGNQIGTVWGKIVTNG